MNKKEFVTEVAKNAEISKKDASFVTETVIKTIMENVANGEKISFLGFGTFELAERAGRTGVNPLTGEPLVIKPSKRPKFRPGKAFKAFCNE